MPTPNWQVRNSFHMTISHSGESYDSSNPIRFQLVQWHNLATVHARTHTRTHAHAHTHTHTHTHAHAHTHTSECHTHLRKWRCRYVAFPLVSSCRKEDSQQCQCVSVCYHCTMHPSACCQNWFYQWLCLLCTAPYCWMKTCFLVCCTCKCIGCVCCVYGVCVRKTTFPTFASPCPY